MIMHDIYIWLLFSSDLKGNDEMRMQKIRFFFNLETLCITIYYNSEHV